jgi:hypothetical protein
MEQQLELSDAMRTYLADTFQAALTKLDNQSQKAAKLAAFELQMDPTGHGKQFHRINQSREKNFWSVRASRDIRLIVHKDASRLTLCYVDHHDDAYDWAERRVFERHPRTGALQIVEVLEKVREVAPDTVPEAQADMFVAPKQASETAPAPTIFPLAEVGADRLQDFGVPKDWAELLVELSQTDALETTVHLPGEAAEAVRLFLAGEEPEPLAEPEAIEATRFRMVEHRDELEAALDYPWERWTVFLHPSQRRFATAEYSGPARVAGSAGTGKTVVALHRALRLSRTSGANVLLATFSEPLAMALSEKLAVLNGGTAIVPSVKVASFLGLARELFELNTGRRPRLIGRDTIERRLAAIAPDDNAVFLANEFIDVVDPWRVETIEDYRTLKRTGRRSRIGQKRRELIWPWFEQLRVQLDARNELTKAQLFAWVEDYYSGVSNKPFTHIVVDEAQDLGVPELRCLAALAPSGIDRLFFAGDLGQRIFKLPFSWKSLGVDIRGRSNTLKVNYRTSHQIREQLDRLLPEELSDLDGLVEDRTGTISVFNGAAPEIVAAESEDEETNHVVAWVGDLIDQGYDPQQIGIIVRSDDQLIRARTVASRLGIETQILIGSVRPVEGRLSVGIMQLAKGLEFRAVAVMACDADIVPLESRIEGAETQSDLDEIWQTERQLLYVAATRAREQLLISGVTPVSEYLSDLEQNP